MSQEPNQEDLSIVAVIAALERGADPSPAEASHGDETAETLARLYTEVLGLIPIELAPVAPSAGARDRLLAAIGAAPAAAAAEPRPAPVAAPPPAPAAPAAPTAPTAVTQAFRPAPRVAPGPIPRRQSRWPLALAAVVALAFAGASVWLWQLQQGQRAEIAQLRQELVTQRKVAAKAAEDGRQARTEMDNMRARFALVTSPAVEVLPLRPVGDQTNARGMLFVAPDHQHWYLSMEGLPPATEGVYKLWWMTAQGPQDAGYQVTQSGEKFEMSSDEMPAGTTGVLVTLEPAPGSSQPTGPEILRAGP